MFKYKSAAEIAAMTPDEQDSYAKAKREFEAEATKAQIKEALEAFKKENPSISKEAFDALKDDVQLIKENTQGGEGNHLD